MKLTPLALAACFALAAPALARADVVYFKQRTGHGIDSVSGKIVRETGGVVEIVTESGRTVSIPKSDVFQIVRDEAGAETKAAETDSEQVVRRGTSRRILPEEPSEPKRILHYGFKGGMNLGNMSVDPQAWEEEDSLKSFALGIWWAAELRPRLSLLAEVLYSVKGDSEEGGGLTSTTRLTYFDVPVLAKMSFLGGGSAQPSLFAGPCASINLSAHSKLEGSDADFDLDVKDQTRGLALSFVVGSGVDFPVRGRTYGVDLRYSLGLTDALGDKANGDARANVIAVMGSVGLQ